MDNPTSEILNRNLNKTRHNEVNIYILIQYQYYI